MPTPSPAVDLPLTTPAHDTRTSARSASFDQAGGQAGSNALPLRTDSERDRPREDAGPHKTVGAGRAPLKRSFIVCVRVCQCVHASTAPMGDGARVEVKFAHPSSGSAQQHRVRMRSRTAYREPLRLSCTAVRQTFQSSPRSPSARTRVRRHAECHARQAARQSRRHWHTSVLLDG